MSLSSLVSSAALALLLSSAGPSEAAPLAGHHRQHTHAGSAGAPGLGRSTFRVPQQRNQNFIRAGKGARAYAKAYHKYGVKLPQRLDSVLQGILAQILTGTTNVNAVQATASSGGSEDESTDGAKVTASVQGEVAAVPELFDSEYLSAVQIGTPPQPLMLDFDTGSSDLWVFSSETPASQEQGQKEYNIGASSTAAKMDGASWSITYGDGSTSSGDVYTDTVTIGGVAVADQAIESAQKVSSSFTSDNASSGLLGLAFDHINQISPNPQKTFFSNALETLAEPIFTANLKKGEAGNYNFGFIDPTEYAGSISYTPINSSRGFWEFSTSGYSVGPAGSSASAAPHQAIADTGTTLLLLPDDIVAGYYAAVAGAGDDGQHGGFTFPCASVLPDLTLHLGSGYAATVPGELVRFAPADSDSIDTATTCFGGVQSAGDLPFAIYGDIFLKAQFAVFDAGNMQLGLAAKPS